MCVYENVKTADSVMLLTGFVASGGRGLDGGSGLS